MWERGIEKRKGAWQGTVSVLGKGKESVTEAVRKGKGREKGAWQRVSKRERGVAEVRKGKGREKGRGRSCKKGEGKGKRALQG